MLDLHDCTVFGSAVTTAFLCDGLARVTPLPVISASTWQSLGPACRRGSPDRVRRSLIIPLATALGYGKPARQEPVATREGQEDGGWLLPSRSGNLRVWTVSDEIDLDAPIRSPRAHRGSPTRVAERVLRSRGEPAGLVTNGQVLRLLLCDPAHADSHVTLDLDHWRQAPDAPDSLRMLASLAAAANLARLPAVFDAARLHQVRVTGELRSQARDAIVGFINALPARPGITAAVLWQECLVLVYRLLFILKMESPAEPGLGFTFASTRLWREALSPNLALGVLVRRHLDHGHDTGQMLETGLRSLFTAFRDGLTCTELQISPLGGALFGGGSTLHLDRLPWGERAVAILLDSLIWLTADRGERVRVHYGSLDVEDLGSIYEGLLEQDPGIATQPMSRVRRGRHDAVVPDATTAAGILPGQFFLSAGTGRKASGSYYTPHEFVRFLVREALDPKIAALSPPDDPYLARLLTLRIVDPSTGSGHFLVQACRHLAEAVLTACRHCDERGLHDRIAALPDADNTIAAYLPSRGFAEARARAICRRLVAVHCLYGCDKNQLAVELAKLSLWLESYAEGLPLTFLDHRLLHGDALTGPFFGSLASLPVGGGALDPLLARGVSDRLQAALARARSLVTEMGATVGRDLSDLAAKQSAKCRLDNALHPLRQLARAWSGAAMARDNDADDVWLGLATHVAETGSWPPHPTPRQAALTAGGADALSWDLAFPEVFPEGFSVVLGNPPWDVVLPSTRDFVAGFDPDVLHAKARSERSAIEQTVLSRPGMAAAFAGYRAAFDRLKSIAARLYRHQRMRVGEQTTAGNLDLFRLFAERNMELAAPDGAIGVLLPSAFHANEGTTGIRHLYLQQSDMRWCLSFENRRRIFDIDSRFKFDLIVAHRPGPTRSLRCGFYLDRIQDAADPKKIMTYDRDFLIRSGGRSLTPLELRGDADLQIAERLFAQPERLDAWCAARHIRFGCDLHMTADAGLFQPPGQGDLILHEGKTFHQYTDVWDTEPRHSLRSGSLRSAIAEAATTHRLVFRDIARSNDERTMIACIAPPGTVFGHTATVEKTPFGRSADDAYLACALFNSYPFDWLVRQKASVHLSLYLLHALPVPTIAPADRTFLIAAARTLSGTASNSGACLTDPRRRWLLRARIDAVIARSYDLTRDQYAHLLASFSHRSFPAAPALCLEAFDARPDYAATAASSARTRSTCRSRPYRSATQSR